MKSAANCLVGIGNYLSLVIPKKTGVKSLYVFFIAFSVLFQPLVVKATPVTISNGYQLNGIGSFTGTLEYIYTSSSTASLTLVLNNLLTAQSGEKITGVALNLPGVAGVSFTGLSSNAPNSSFTQLWLSNDGINTSPLGKFDFGSALGGNWLGGGSPGNGISAGSSGTFVFNFTGTNLNAISTLDFVNFVASDNVQGSPQFMAVRFRGGAGDKVGASYSLSCTGTQCDQPPTVPVPPSVWLLLSGLGGLGLLSRKSKN